MNFSEERELTKENIISEIHNDIEQFEKKDTQKEVKSDKYMCRFNLFQFLQLKYLKNKNHAYVGYLMQFFINDNNKKQYSLVNSVIGTLKQAGILSELDEIEIDDDFYELLCQYYSDDYLNQTFLKIISENGIEYDKKISQNYELFNVIKKYDKTIFYTYYRKITKKGEISKNKFVKENAYFFFRYFCLSDKYLQYENVLWESLKEEFGWRLKYKIVRNF